MSSDAATAFDLFSAVSGGNIQEVDRLVRMGVDVNIRDPLDGSTCLFQAIVEHDVSIARRLLDGGADPNIYTQNTRTSPLGCAAIAGDIEMVVLLIASKARLSDDELATGILGECERLGLHNVVEAISCT
jgi:ankyrin repeat protein